MNRIVKLYTMNRFKFVSLFTVAAVIYDLFYEMRYLYTFILK